VDRALGIGRGGARRGAPPAGALAPGRRGAPGQSVRAGCSSSPVAVSPLADAAARSAWRQGGAAWGERWVDGGESMWCAACGAYSVPELAGAGLAELAGADAAALPRSAKVDRVAQIVRAAAAEGEKARPLLETVDRDCSRPLHAAARRHAAAARRSSGSFCIVSPAWLLLYGSQCPAPAPASGSATLG